MSDKDFWMLVRQALLLFVDAIERGKLGMRETTADLRNLRRRAKSE